MHIRVRNFERESILVSIALHILEEPVPPSPGTHAREPVGDRSHNKCGGRLSSLSAVSEVIIPAAEHHRPLAGTKLYCLVTEARGYEQLT